MIGKLKQMHVLIIGLRGLGVEVAKNLILAGPHSVSVYDEGIVAVEDLGTNFYRQSQQHTQNRGEKREQHKPAVSPKESIEGVCIVTRIHFVGLCSLSLPRVRSLLSVQFSNLTLASLVPMPLSVSSAS